MLSSEELRVLSYLNHHARATAADVGQACFAGASHEWVGRVLANLDWLGYVTLFPGGAVVTVTQRGRELGAMR